MLLFTKEELKSRISCLKQMMNALNIKMNYFENLLQGLECSATEKHCLIINVSFADVPMDAFMECDTIEVVTNSNNFKDRDKHFNYESKIKNKNIPKHKRNKTPRIVNIEPNPESTNILTVKQEDVILPTNNISSNFLESSENSYKTLMNNESVNEVSLPLSTNDYEVARESPQEDIKQNSTKHQNQFISQISEDQALISMENSCSILSSLMFNESLDHLNSTSKLSQNTAIQSSNVNQRSSINSYPFSQSNDVFPPTSSLDLISNVHMNPIPDHIHVTRNHQSTSIKIKSYLCSQCNAKFNNLSNRNRHVRLKHEHLNSRPFQCQTCMKSFKLHHHLKEHLQRCINRCDQYGY